MSLESSLWKWLKRAWDKLTARRLHYTRVENAASSGMPDVEGCIDGKQFWLELKVASRPKSADDVVVIEHLRPKQIEWLHNRWLVNGRAWLLLRVEGGDLLPTHHYLIPGHFGRRVFAGMTEAEMENVAVVHPLSNPIVILTRASM